MKRAPGCELVSDKRTICEVHRELYDIAVEHLKDSPHREVIMHKLEEAYLMGKKMNAKLRQYKFNYDDGWWEQVSREIVADKQTLRSQSR